MQAQNSEPFYFKSYGSTVGIARGLKELQDEFTRLSRANPEVLRYHLKEGHIVEWLDYINERELANQFVGVESIEEARALVKMHLNKGWKESCCATPYHRGRNR